jgi:hypothetical protein
MRKISSIERNHQAKIEEKQFLQESKTKVLPQLLAQRQQRCS